MSRSLDIAEFYRLAIRMHALLPYYVSRGGRAFPAWHYYLEVTRRCNLRCVMCQYIQWLKSTPVHEQEEGELTTAEWLDVIRQIPRSSLITFTGGEPLLRKDFLDILEAGSRRARTHFITNATLLNEEKARRDVALAPKRLGGKGLNFVGVSIDGPRDLHDKIRSMPGAFDRGIEGIRRIIEFRKKSGKKCPMIHVTTVIQDKNVDCLHEMPRVVAETGADVCNLTLEIRTLELPGIGEQAPDQYRMSQVTFPRIEPARLVKALADTRAAARAAGIELRAPDMPDDAIVRYYDGKMDLSRFRCEAIWTRVFVGCKGNVYPCWIKKIGNVREKSLKELWNAPEMRAFRCKMRQGLAPPCVGCCTLVGLDRKGNTENANS